MAMSKCNSKNLKKRKDAEDNIIASNAIVDSDMDITADMIKAIIKSWNLKILKLILF